MRLNVLGWRQALAEWLPKYIIYKKKMMQMFLARLFFP